MLHLVGNISKEIGWVY